MKDAYAAHSTFRDQGEVVTVFDPGKPNSFTKVQLVFTLFMRPDRFRYEFRERTLANEPSWTRDAILARGSTATIYSNRHEPEPQPSVHLALAGVFNMVPTMLTPEPNRAGDRSPSNLSIVVGQQEINAELCDIVEQRGTFDVQRRLWIGRETRLLPRVEQTVVVTRARMAEMDRREEEFAQRRQSTPPAAAAQPLPTH